VLKAGQDLNVRAIITGRVRHACNMLIIQSDLVDVSTGTQLWAITSTGRSPTSWRRG
jgi:TolB-like protein